MRVGLCTFKINRLEHRVYYKYQKRNSKECLHFAHTAYYVFNTIFTINNDYFPKHFSAGNSL